MISFEKNGKVNSPIKDINLKRASAVQW